MEIVRKVEFAILLGIIYLLLAFNEGDCQQKRLSNGVTNILPAPQTIKSKAGIFLNLEKVRTIYLYSQASEDDRFAAHLLQDKLNRLFNHSINLQKVDSYDDLSRPAVLLGIPSDDSIFSNFSSALPAPKKGTEESYVLDINKDLVTISGGGKAGLFYGVQTLMQLIEEAKWNDQPLHGKLIQDWPDLKLRVVHFDEKHHLDRYKYLKKAIAKLAKYKVNGILFEFENKFHYQSHPDIAAPNSFTPRQVKELTQYAHKYHVNIIPLVQGLGHAGYILKHDNYKHLRENPESNWAFNPLKEGTYDLLFDLYSEAIKATPGVKYFHVGGDEVRFTGKNKQLQEYEKKHGKLALYLTWLNKVHKFLKKQGRTIIFWDDVPLKRAGIYKYTYSKAPDRKFDSLWTDGIAKLDNIVDKFPQDAVFNRWNYGMAREKGNVRIMEWYNKQHFKQISATAVQNSRPLIPSYDQKPANIKSFVTLSAKKKVLGEICTAWDDSGVHFETFWMGFLASAEYAWSSKSPVSLDRYWAKYLRRFFGPNATDLNGTFHNLSNRVDFWDTALMKKGRKHLIHRKGNELIKLPTFKNLTQSGDNHFRALMESARAERQKNIRAIKTLEKNANQVKHNTYNLKVFASMGRFMEAHAELVVSIGKIARYRDKALAADKEDQKDQVLTYMYKMATTADSAWQQYRKSYENMKKVWEVSRYSKGGKEFIPNRYGHFASQREDLSYLIMAEEQLNLPGYAKKIRDMANKYKTHENFSLPKKISK